MKLDILSEYELSEDSLDNGVEVVLSKGLKVRLRHTSCPQFQKAIGLIKDDGDVEKATVKALVEGCVISLGEGKKKVDDKKTILEVLSNPVYSQLTDEILKVCRDYDNFLASKVDSVKKS